VAPLQQLARCAEEAHAHGAPSRALAFREQTLASAEASQPRDSLITAALLRDLVYARIMRAQGVHAALRTPAFVRRVATAWRTDALSLALSRRALEVLRGRWRAGTLLTPTAEEQAFLAGGVELGLELLVGAAYDAATCWPAPLRATAHEEARLRGIAGALHASLELDAIQRLRRSCDDGNAPPPLAPRAAQHAATLAQLLSAALAGGGPSCLLVRLRAVCRLSSADEAALRQLAARTKAALDATTAEAAALAHSAHAAAAAPS
jgi:hypothetical protein